MLRIRLSRAGRKNLPFFRVAVYDSHTRRDGPVVERLGHYDPRKGKPAEKITIDAERLRFWIGKGAQLTPALRRLLKHAGIPS
jgi:small subunit ribosomal protein S16